LLQKPLIAKTLDIMSSIDSLKGNAMTRIVTEPFSMNQGSDRRSERDRDHDHDEALQRSDAQKVIDAGFVPALDVTKMLTSMFELGARMMRIQQQMFAGILAATAGPGETSHRSANRRPAEQQIQAEHELIARRAWEIARSARARGDLDNWLLAEDELRASGRIADV
jgi:hypothetical protein